MLSQENGGEPLHPPRDWRIPFWPRHSPAAESRAPVSSRSSSEGPAARSFLIVSLVRFYSNLEVIIPLENFSFLYSIWWKEWVPRKMQFWTNVRWAFQMNTNIKPWNSRPASRARDCSRPYCRKSYSTSVIVNNIIANNLIICNYDIAMLFLSIHWVPSLYGPSWM